MSELSLLDWFYIESIAVSFILIAFLLHSLRKKILEVKELSLKLQNSINENVGEFLTREIDLSEKLLIKRRQTKEKAPSVLRALSLRKNLLSIELDCLNEDGQMPSRINEVIEKLIAYFKVSPWLRSANQNLTPEKAISGTMDSVDKNKDRIVALVDVQRETILELREKLKKAGLSGLEDKQLGEAANSEAVLLLEKRLEEGKQSYLELKRRFDFLVIESEKKKVVDEGANEIADKMLAQVGEKYNAALNDLENIRQINNQKRNHIERIEADLRNNEADLPDDQEEADITEAVQKLKLQLRDSEMCTAVLESEVESLRDELNKLSLQKKEWQEKIEQKEGGEDISLDAELFSSYLDAVSDIVLSKDNVNVEKVINEFTPELKSKVTFLMIDSGVERWISNVDLVSSSIKDLLRNSEQHPANQWVSLPQGNIYVCQSIRCLISEVSVPEIKIISSLLMVASGKLLSIYQQGFTNKGRESLIQIASGFKKSIDTMEKKNKELSETGLEAFETFIQDVGLFLNGLGLSDREQSLFAQIETELHAEMNAIFQRRRASDEEFKKLLVLLEEKAAEF